MMLLMLARRNNGICVALCQISSGLMSSSASCTGEMHILEPSSESYFKCEYSVLFSTFLPSQIMRNDH